MDLTFFQKSLQFIGAISWKKALPISIAIYLVLFLGQNPILPSQAEGWLLPVRLLMVALFLVAVVDVLALTSGYVWKEMNKRNDSRSMRKANVSFTVSGLIGKLKRELKQPFQKIEGFSSNMEVSSELYALYSELHWLKLPTPSLEFNAPMGRVDRHLNYLLLIYPLVESGKFRELRKQIKQLDLSS